MLTLLPGTVLMLGPDGNVNPSASAKKASGQLHLPHGSLPLCGLIWLKVMFCPPTTMEPHSFPLPAGFSVGLQTWPVFASGTMPSACMSVIGSQNMLAIGVLQDCGCSVSIITICAFGL